MATVVADADANAPSCAANSATTASAAITTIVTTTTSAGAAFTQQPIVTVYDSAGDIATSYDGSVYVALAESPTGTISSLGGHFHPAN